MDAQNIPPALIYTATASSGGIAKYLHEYVKTGIFKLEMLAANLFVSTFSGYMFASFGSFIGLEPQLSYSLAGLGGFMGVRAIDFIEEIIRSKSRMEPMDNSKEESG